MRHHEQIGSFVGLHNNGKLFAVGGVVLPLYGNGYLSAFGSRGPIVGPVNNVIQQTVLPRLVMPESPERTPRDLLSDFALWFVDEVATRPNILWVVGGDPAYEADRLLFDWYEAEFGQTISRMAELLDIEAILAELRVDRALIEGLVGPLDERNSHHPNNLGSRRIGLVRKAFDERTIQPHSCGIKGHELVFTDPPTIREHGGDLTRICPMCKGAPALNDPPLSPE